MNKPQPGQPPFAPQQIYTVFLDRDGVINRKPPEGQYVGHWRDFDILPGVPEAIAQLNRSGRRVLVVTNQRGVALNLYTSADVNTLHGQLQAHLAEHSAHIDAFYFCPHDTNELGCDCRKPALGLFEQAFRAFPDATPANSLVIGDSISDIQAAHALNVPSIFIEGDPETQKPGAATAATLATATAGSLLEAVSRYLA